MLTTAGNIAVFTSYRAGVGRTMAVANVAWMLANAGCRVLAVDWNFSAPRLAEFFHPFWPQLDPRSEAGVIDALWEHVLNQSRSIRGEKSDAEPTLLEYAITLKCDFPREGTLDFLNVGFACSYEIRKELFPFEAFFSELGGQWFIDFIRQAMHERYDYVLVDGPQFLEDQGGICMHGLADTVIACFTPSGNEPVATAELIRRIQDHRAQLPIDRFLRVIPLLMRTEHSELQLFVEARRRISAAFAPLSSGGSLVKAELEVPYIPFFLYQPAIAAFAAQYSSGSTIYQAYQKLLVALTSDEALIGRIPTSAEQDTVMARYAQPPDPVLRPKRPSLFGPARRLQPSNAQSGYFFVSYARKDFDRIALTLDQIQQMGHDLWWDIDIEPGASWKDVLSIRIEQSRGVILFATKKAAASEFVTWELSAARKAGKSLFAVKLDDVEPACEVGALLAQNQYVPDPGVHPSRELELALRRMRAKV
jgi:cellulose biosynthesis protein BcsQ